MLSTEVSPNMCGMINKNNDNSKFSLQLPETPPQDVSKIKSPQRFV